MRPSPDVCRMELEGNELVVICHGIKGKANTVLCIQI